MASIPPLLLLPQASASLCPLCLALLPSTPMVNALERNPVFCVEKKASRLTLVDVHSDAQIGIAIVLTNTDWVVYGEPMHAALNRLD
ncbi:hypothetical protein ZEAMMB73_Zm00001d024001 [Zea mays]|uniref:Uncharacterized protein n=1 Tax=Zea mays TaxID=4577 RepID=A0A1D6IX87_MAIZE|nr:hypothetical protein ZEAMMB73_Zm00001d024001 [Zea mays]